MKLSNFKNTNLLQLSKKNIVLTILKDWIVTTITGKDSKKYLQSQITINMRSIDKRNHQICSHCNVSGKVYSNLLIFKINTNNYMYLQRKSVSNKQIKKLKKYSVFSNITISNNIDTHILGIFGMKAKEKLLEYFKEIPSKNFSVYHKNNDILLWFDSPFERFLIITKKNSDISNHILQLTNEIKDDTLWTALDISSKFPIIDYETSEKFFPQSLNLENLKGLDFKKGCYHGQEMISKIQFKMLNRYNLYWLIGKFKTKIHIGEIIEIKYDTMWKNIGYILAIAQIDKKEVWIQAVLKNNVEQKNTLRIKNDEKNILYMQI
ncbi:MAG: tRNA-modifying protein YgfZ [Buchnera aphidicola (Schlechtendalia peitan)]